MTEAVLHFVVTEADTARALGSGSLPVLATPRLLAWCEAATCAAIAESLAQGQTSVGTRVSLEHLAASPVGAQVEITAAQTYGTGDCVGSRSQHAPSYPWGSRCGCSAAGRSPASSSRSTGSCPDWAESGNEPGDPPGCSLGGC